MPAVAVSGRAADLCHHHRRHATHLAGNTASSSGVDSHGYQSGLRSDDVYRVGCDSGADVVPSQPATRQFFRDNID